MRTVLLIFGLWLLINLLFVLLVVPSRRPRPPARPSERRPSPAPIHEKAADKPARGWTNPLVARGLSTRKFLKRRPPGSLVRQGGRLGSAAP